MNLTFPNTANSKDRIKEKKPAKITDFGVGLCTCVFAIVAAKWSGMGHGFRYEINIGDYIIRGDISVWHSLMIPGIGLMIWDYLPANIENRRYQRLFKALGLYVKTDDREVVPLLINKYKSKDSTQEKLYFTLPDGLSLKDFQDCEQAIKESLNVEELKMRYIEGKIEMILYKNKLQDYYDFELVRTKKPTEIVIGYSIEGLITLTLDDSYCHLLVGGLTGYGKTVFIMQMLTHLILTKDPGEVELFLGDMKRVDLFIFKRCKHVKRYENTIEGTLDMLKEVQSTMYERLDMLEKAGVNHISKYRGKMPRLLVVIDEIATYLVDKDIQKEAVELMHDIASKSRAAGIHLILCTQRPSADVVPGLLKAQLPATLAFKTRNKINSQILLDNDRAAELTRRGQAILQTDKEMIVQVMHITPDKAKSLIKHTYVKEKKKAHKKVKEIVDGVIDLAAFARSEGY